MTDKQGNPQKSANQPNRGTVYDQTNESSVCIPISRQTSTNRPSQSTGGTPQTSQRDKPPAQGTPTRYRSAAPTPRQSQSKDKASAQNTPTNSVACLAKGKASAQNTPTNSVAGLFKDKSSSKAPGGNNASNPTQRSLPTREKQSPLFNPTLTSTPRSSQIKVQSQQKGPQTFQPTTTQDPICPPCPLVCPGDSPGIPQSLIPVSTPTERGRPIDFCPVVPSDSCLCVPRNAVTLNLTSAICLPEEPTEQPHGTARSKGPEGVKRERILKLEILSISGGSIYDVDKIQQGSSVKAQPKYDPCFDVDRMVSLKAATKGAESESGTSGTEEADHKAQSRENKRKPTLVNEEDEDTVLPKSTDDESTLRKDTTSNTESTFSPDSTLLEQRKGAGKEDDDNEYVMRAAPLAPAPFNVSELSLTDMPPVKEEKEDQTMLAPPTGLGDDYLPIRDVSLTRDDPGLLDISGIDDSKDGTKGGEAGTKGGEAGTKGGEADTEGGEAGTKEREAGAKADKDGEAGAKADKDGGANVKMERDGEVKEERDGQAEVKVERDREAGAKGGGVNAKSVGEDKKGIDEAGTSDRAAKTPVAQRTPRDAMTDEGRGSMTLMLGPSVRNLARLALSPLVALRTLLGPAPNARPGRKKHLRRFLDDLDPPEYARIRSIRSALVVTPYEATASTFALFLRREVRCTNHGVTTDSNESESSSEEEW